MRCTTAGKLITERRGRPGQRLHPALAAELDQHLAGCPSCAADASLEARLAAHLAPAPFAAPRPVDVRARVLIALVAEPPVDRRVVSARQIVAGAVLAGAAIVAVALSAAWLGPALVDRVGDTGVVAQLGTGFERGLRTARALGIAAVETLRAMLRTLVDLVTAISAVRRVWSLAFAALGHLALASMLLLSAWWIGRDVLRPARRAAREETPR
jgi:hypothetical protein